MFNVLLSHAIETLNMSILTFWLPFFRLPQAARHHHNPIDLPNPVVNLRSFRKSLMIPRSAFRPPGKRTVGQTQSHCARFPVLHKSQAKMRLRKRVSGNLIPRSLPRAKAPVDLEGSSVKGLQGISSLGSKGLSTPVQVKVRTPQLGFTCLYGVFWLFIEV